MQRLLFFLLVPFCFISYSAPAQWERQYYLKGGWTYAMLRSSEAESEAAGGVSLGLGAKYPLRNHWWLQTELSFERYQAVTPTNPNDQQYRFSYLAIPLMLSYRRSDLLEFYGGIQPALLFRAEGFPVNDPASRRTYSKDDFSRLQVWPLLGLEVNISPLNLGVRYFYNPLPLTKSDRVISETGEARLQGIQVYGALAF